MCGSPAGNNPQNTHDGFTNPHIEATENKIQRALLDECYSLEAQPHQREPNAAKRDTVSRSFKPQLK